MGLYLKIANIQEELFMEGNFDTKELEKALNTLNFVNIGNSIINKGNIQYFLPEKVEHPNINMLLTTGKLVELYENDFDVNAFSSLLNKRQLFVSIGGAIINQNMIQQIDYIQDK